VRVPTADRLDGIRLGVPSELTGEGIEPGVLEAFRNTLKLAEELGATVEEMTLPHAPHALSAYYVLAPAEASSNLARYDGVRYGLRVPGRSIGEMYENTRARGFGAEVRRRVMIGTYVLSAGYYDAYYLRAQKVRTLIKKDFEDCFAKGVHAMLTPATPSAAFGLGEKGHAELLDVFKRLPSRATLVSAGSTTPGVGCFDAFAEEAERINGGRRFPEKRVVMLEGRDRPLVRDMLKCADLFVLLSNIEASPLVLYEAAAAGVPFIASDVGNSGEIAKWTNGGVIVRSRSRPNGRVKASRSDALWKMTRLVRARQSREAMGAAAREAWKRRFTWERLAADYLELYARSTAG